MPELPEVETLARDLRATVVGRKITKATVSPDAPRLVQEMPVELFESGLRGHRIEDVSRRGGNVAVAGDDHNWNMDFVRQQPLLQFQAAQARHANIEYQASGRPRAILVLVEKLLGRCIGIDI